MVIFAIEKKKNCLQVLFKERIAHDMRTQLRILLNEALKINPSAVFSLLDSKDIRLSLGKRNSYIPQSHGQREDFRTTHKYSCRNNALVKQSLWQPLERWKNIS